MSVASEATAKEEDLRHLEIKCSYRGIFCGYCPDIPPCQIPTKDENGKNIYRYIDCENCSTELRISWSGNNDCPCFHGPGSKRYIKYKEWLITHNDANAISAARRQVYNVGKNRFAHYYRYTQNRVCAEENCSKRITNKNRSGLCKSCLALKRGEEKRNGQ